jgi:hypothetical protein
MVGVPTANNRTVLLAGVLDRFPLNRRCAAEESLASFLSQLGEMMGTIQPLEKGGDGHRESHLTVDQDTDVIEADAHELAPCCANDSPAPGQVFQEGKPARGKKRKSLCPTALRAAVDMHRHAEIIEGSEKIMVPLISTPIEVHEEMLTAIKNSHPPLWPTARV